MVTKIATAAVQKPEKIGKFASKHRQIRTKTFDFLSVTQFRLCNVLNLQIVQITQKVNSGMAFTVMTDIELEPDFFYRLRPQPKNRLRL